MLCDGVQPAGFTVLHLLNPGAQLALYRSALINHDACARMPSGFAWKQSDVGAGHTSKTQPSVMCYQTDERVILIPELLTQSRRRRQYSAKGLLHAGRI